MQDRYRGAELLSVLLQILTGNVAGTGVETQGRRYGPLSSCLPMYPRHANTNRHGGLWTRFQRPTLLTILWRVPFVFLSGGQEALQNPGWDTESLWKSAHNKAEVPPSTGTVYPLPAAKSLQASAGLTNSRRAPHSSVQASHRPSIPELWVYLKFEVLKADLSGVSFTAPCISEDRVWGRTTRVGMRMRPFGFICACFWKGICFCGPEKLASFGSQQYGYMSSVLTAN